MNTLKILLGIVVLYIYIHNPLLFFLGGTGSIKILYPLMLLFLCGYYRKYLSMDRDLLYVYLLILFYTFLRSAFGGDPIHLHVAVIALIEVVLLSSILASACIKYKVPLYKILFLTGAVSAVISMCCLLFPLFNYFIKFRLTLISDYLDSVSFRGFGLSDGLTYSYGIALGIIFSYFLEYLKQYKWFILFVPFLLIAIAVNARTGLLIVLTSTLIYLFFHLRRGGGYLLLIILSLYVFSLSGFKFEDDQTEMFVMEFFREVSDSLFGTNLALHSTKDALFNNMAVFPETDIQWIFGRGIGLFLDKSHNTDIGFLLQLNYGGIVYILLLFFMLYQLFKKINNQYLLFVSVAIFIIANVKGDFIINSGGFRLLFLLIVYQFYLLKTEREEISE
ncbi:hypothetical protein [Bacteroides sp.]